MKPAKKKFLIITIVIVLVGGLGFVGWRAWAAYRSLSAILGGDDPRAGAAAIEKLPELNPYVEAKTNPFKDAYENPFE